MPGESQQGVALLHRLAHQAQFTVLEVADAAVDHAARRTRSPGREVAALHECDVDTVEREFAEYGEAVDAPADDEHAGGWALEQFAHVRPHAGLGRCLLPHTIKRARTRPERWDAAPLG